MKRLYRQLLYWLGKRPCRWYTEFVITKEWIRIALKRRTDKQKIIDAHMETILRMKT